MGNKIDEVGNRYGRLTVVEESNKKTGPGIMWLCACDCGGSVITRGTNLRFGHTRSCGCISREAIDETGNKYGRLLVIKEAKRNVRGAFWLCRCNCGNETVVVGGSLRRSGGTRSCGCLMIETTVKSNSLPGGESGFNKLYAGYKNSAGKRKLLFELSREDFRKLTKQPCCYCGVNPTQVSYRKRVYGSNRYIYNGIDRIDNDKAYMLDNVVPCCGQCNMAKGSLSVDEFLCHMKRIYDYSIKDS